MSDSESTLDTSEDLIQGESPELTSDYETHTSEDTDASSDSGEAGGEGGASPQEGKGAAGDDTEDGKKDIVVHTWWDYPRGEDGPQFNSQLRSAYMNTVRFFMRQWYVSVFMGLAWPTFSLIVSGMLGVFALTIGSIYFDESCGRNLYKWLLIVGLVHMVGVWISLTRLMVFIFGYASIRRANLVGRTQLRRLGLYLDMFNLAHVVICTGLYIYGLVLIAYTDNDSDCPDLLYDTVFAYQIIFYVRLIYWVPLMLLCICPLLLIASVCLVEKLVLCFPRLINISVNLVRMVCCWTYVPNACLPSCFQVRYRIPKLNLSWNCCCVISRPYFMGILNERVVDPLLLHLPRDEEIAIRRFFGHLLDTELTDPMADDAD